MQRLVLLRGRADGGLVYCGGNPESKLRVTSWISSSLCPPDTASASRTICEEGIIRPLRGFRQCLDEVGDLVEDVTVDGEAPVSFSWFPSSSSSVLVAVEVFKDETACSWEPTGSASAA